MRAARYLVLLPFLLLMSAHFVALQVAQAPELVTVRDSTVVGADSLASAELQEIHQAITGQTGDQATLVEKLRHLLAVKIGGHGYLHAKIRTEVRPLDRNDPQQVAFATTVQSGTKFHLRTFRFEGNEAFSSAQLEELAPVADMRNGDLSGLRSVYFNVNEFYRKAGYTSAKAIPSRYDDESTGTFDLVVRIDEGAAPPVLPPSEAVSHK